MIGAGHNMMLGLVLSSDKHIAYTQRKCKASMVYRDQTDENLMTLYSEGNIQAFEELYHRHKGPVFRFFKRQFNAAVAEELMQDVWARIIKARKDYHTQNKFTTYLYSIARNRQIDHFRRQSIRPVPMETDDSDVVDNMVNTIQTPVVDEPDAMINADERHQALLHCIKQLPPQQREAFLLKEESGLSLEIIAVVVGINAESVKSRLRYAIQKLKKCMGQLL